MKEISSHLPPEKQYKDSTGFIDIPFVRSIIDASREIIALLDRDGILIDFNRALEIRLQKNRAEIIGSCIWNYFPAEISDNRKFLTEQVFLTGKAEHLEDFRDGIWNDSIISPVFDEKGGVTHVTVHVVDITDRKKSEELKYQYHIMLDNLSANIPGVIFEFSRDKEGLYFMNFISKGSDKLFGIPAKQLTGPMDTGIVHPADEKLFFKSIDDSGESLTVWECEFRIISPEGKVKWIMGKSLPRKEADGRIIWNGVLVDISKEKKLEEELRNREIMLKTAQNVAHLGYYQLDVQTGEAEWSDETFNIFGLDPSGYIPSQQKYQELIHPEDWGELIANLEESIEKKIPFDLVYRIFHSSGEIRYVHSLGKMVKNQDDGNFKMFGTLQDITELKLAEVSLQKAHSRLKALWNISSLSSSNFNTICNTTLNAIVEMTGSPYGFLGFLNENESIMTIYSWSGKAMKDCMMPGRQDEFIIRECGVWGEAVRQRKPLIMNDFSIPHHAKKGLPEGHVSLSRLLVVPVFSQKRIVSVAAVANSSAPYTESDISQITSFMSGIQSILDKREAEAKIQASEETLRKAQKVAHLGSWEWYIETNRLSWSDEMYNIFGISREEFTGDLSDIMTRYIHPDDLTAMEQSNRSVIESGKPILLEYRIIRPDGSVRNIWAEAGELKVNKDGNPSVLSGIVQDITEQKKTEGAKKKLESQLQHSQKMDAIGQIASGVAHDFNNVLSGIIGSAQLLQLKEKNLSEKGQKYINTILNASEKASVLTNKLLLFSRKKDLEKKIIDINAVITETVEILENSIDKRVTIKVIESEKNLYVSGDSASIENVLINICINSSQAMPVGGEISISANLINFDKSSDDFSFSELETGNYINIRIADEGEGIPGKYLDKIFDPFFTTKETGKGTGLGLATAYGIIKDHYGEIKVESKVNKGTTFNIYLPASEPSEKLENMSSAVSAGTGSILFVDDEEHNRELGLDILESLGYEVMLASDGLEACELYKDNFEEIDLVILDYMMPKMNGKDTFFRIKEINKDCKIILASGYVENSEILKMRENGLSAEIHKPYKIDELSSLLNKVMMNIFV